jgi:hypothetical protein
MIIALIAWRKWPRATANVALAWVATMGFIGIVTGAGRLYLRMVGAEITVYANLTAEYDVAAMFGGVLALLAVTVVLLNRADARREARQS